MANRIPLRWESTRDQWWYVSPIDWAAANGHYDLVREMLRIDSNHLISLTSLRRVRRLEAVWDDDHQFYYVAELRAKVARNLLHDCDCKHRKNSLLLAGHGGWLLYTAASAGDLDFARELIHRNKRLVFGEGEYGITDIFFAAARSRNPAVFWFLYDLALSPTIRVSGEEQHLTGVFNTELIKRAAHAAARGGNALVLKELLRNCADVAALRDRRGCTVLHSAASRGQVEVMKEIPVLVDIIVERDDLGNTALHVAAYKGKSSAVEALITIDSSLIHQVNNAEDTFLHSAIAGFGTHNFRRLDKQMLMMKNLMKWEIPGFEKVVNAKNKEGRSPLHMAIASNAPSELVQLLMLVPETDVNSRDKEGMTPLDLLKQRPTSVSSDDLIREMISAGAIFTSQSARKAIVSRLKLEAERPSPGTRFAIPDTEIILHSKLDEISREDRTLIPENGGRNSPERRLKAILHRQRSNTFNKQIAELQVNPISLRRRHSAPNNKRTVSARSSGYPSPTHKKKAAAVSIHSPAKPLNQIQLRRNSFPEPKEMQNDQRTSEVENVKLKHRRAKSQLCCRDTGVQTPVSRHRRNRSTMAIISVC